MSTTHDMTECVIEALELDRYIHRTLAELGFVVVRTQTTADRLAFELSLSQRYYKNRFKWHLDKKGDS